MDKLDVLVKKGKNMVIDSRYGLVFKQIREQKKLPLSYFEKFGVLKSNLGRFERGKAMMGFERVAVLLQGMNVSLADYENFFNNYLPEYQEHLVFELEKAEVQCDKDRILKLYDEVAYSENRLLYLLVKTKLTKLTEEEVDDIKCYLAEVRYWGYFELSLNHATIEYFDTDQMLKIVRQFEHKTNYNLSYDTMRYRSKIHQIAYTTVLILCQRKERKIAEEILERTIRPEEERLDFYISTFRLLVSGYLKQSFYDKEEGNAEIEHALNIFEELGSKSLREYYYQKVS